MRPFSVREAEMVEERVCCVAVRVASNEMAWKISLSSAFRLGKRLAGDKHARVGAWVARQ